VCVHACSKTEGVSQRYAMTASKRGLFILINNEHFRPESGYQDRRGAYRDSDALQQLFAQLGFEISVFKDVTATDAYSCLEEGSSTVLRSSLLENI